MTNAELDELLSILSKHGVYAYEDENIAVRRRETTASFYGAEKQKDVAPIPDVKPGYNAAVEGLNDSIPTGPVESDIELALHPPHDVRFPDEG